MTDAMRFSSSLYRSDALQGAAQAYGELAEITIESDETGSLVHFLSRDGSEDDSLHLHFRNHVLYETIRRSRAEAAGDELSTRSNS